MSMKRYALRTVLFLLPLILFAFCLLASFGTFADRKLLPGQNQFGGFGQVCCTGNPQMHNYYDDTTFYYPAGAETWGIFGQTMFAYDLRTGTCSSICKRISCTHKTADCPLHPLYQGELAPGSGYWNMIDHAFIAPVVTEKEMQIRCWDPLTDSANTIASVPRYNTVLDGRDISTEYESFFNSAMRINEDLILIGYNNEMHLCDAQFHDVYRFSSQDVMFPLITKDKLCWMEMGAALQCLDLNTGKIESNITRGLFGKKGTVSVWDSKWPYVAFAYGDEIYFPYEGAVYAFDPELRQPRKITEIDPQSEENPYACFGNGNLMYYMLHGTIHRMNLDSGAVTDLPDMPKVPAAAVRDLLLYIVPEPTGSAEDIICFDQSGKPVHS